MALAPVAYMLWQRFLRFDPENPIWPNRDRFVLSAGPRLDAALRAAAPRRGAGGRPRLRDRGTALDHASTTSSASASSTRRPPAIPSTAGPRGSRRRPGPLGQGVATSVGMAVAVEVAGRALQQAGVRAVRLRHLRDLRRRRPDGGRLARGRRRSPAISSSTTSAGSTTTTTSRSTAAPRSPTTTTSASGSRPTAGTSPGSPTPTTSTRSPAPSTRSRRPRAGRR